MRSSEARKRAVLRRSLITGAMAGRSPLRLARTRMPRTPIGERPRLMAMARPCASSIRIPFEWISSARARAWDSPVRDPHRPQSQPGCCAAAGREPTAAATSRKTPGGACEPDKLGLHGRRNDHLPEKGPQQVVAPDKCKIDQDRGVRDNNHTPRRRSMAARSLWRSLIE